MKLGRQHSWYTKFYYYLHPTSLNANLADLGPFSTKSEWAERLEADVEQNEGNNVIPGSHSMNCSILRAKNMAIKLIVNVGVYAAHH